MSFGGVDPSVREAMASRTETPAVAEGGVFCGGVFPDKMMKSAKRMKMS